MFWLLHLILWVHPFQDALNFSRAFTLISITFSPNFRIRTYFLILAYHFNNLYQISHSGPMRVFFFFWTSLPKLGVLPYFKKFNVIARDLRPIWIWQFHSLITQNRQVPRMRLLFGYVFIFCFHHSQLTKLSYQLVRMKRRRRCF